MQINIITYKINCRFQKIFQHGFIIAVAKSKMDIDESPNECSEYGENDIIINNDESRFESDSEDIFVDPNDFEKCEESPSSENNFKRFLIDYAIKFCVPRTHLNALLKGIKTHIEIPFNINLDLPKDYRSLLKTPRNASKYITEASGGKFAYFGIKDGLQRLVNEGYRFEGNREIKLVTFLDGFTPCNNRKNKFWSLLHAVHGDADHHIFMSGIYVGKQEPNPFNDILDQFVKEFNELSAAPFELEGLDFKIKLVRGGPFVMDLPAKADAKNTKQSGYCCCDFCVQIGKWVENKVVLPHLTFKARTNDDFRSRKQPWHHNGFTVLENILDLDLVLFFPHDYMHLVLLGANKRVLGIYMSPKNDQCLPKQQRLLAGDIFESLSTSITKEFMWQPQDLSKWEQFKAKEHRYFLLYAGVVVFKEVLPEEDFKNFMNLSLAIRILCSPDLAKDPIWLKRAENMLYNFVFFLKHSISESHLVRVIHGLLHLVDDAKRYGPLDTFSAFPYESYIYQLKRMLNSPNLPLEQIVRRYKEQELMSFFTRPQNLRSQSGRLGQIHSEGPVLGPGEQHNSVILKEYFVSRSHPDNTIMLSGGEIVIVSNIIVKSNVIYFVGCRYDKVEDYFLSPMTSSGLNIVVAKNLLPKLELYHQERLYKKCINFRYNNQNIIFPLIH